MVSASPGVQAGVSDGLSVRHGIHSSRPKDLRADSAKGKASSVVLRRSKAVVGGTQRFPQNQRGLGRNPCHSWRGGCQTVSQETRDKMTATQEDLGGRVVLLPGQNRQAGWRKCEERPSNPLRSGRRSANLRL